MRNSTVIAFLALALCVLIVEIKSEENLVDQLKLAVQAGKSLHEAKEKFGELEAKAENVAHALGPEGDKLMAKIKALGKTNLKKGLGWVKAIFGHKAPEPAAARV